MLGAIGGDEGMTKNSVAVARRKSEKRDAKKDEKGRGKNARVPLGRSLRGG